MSFRLTCILPRAPPWRARFRGRASYVNDKKAPETARISRRSSPRFNALPQARAATVCIDQGEVSAAV